MAKSKRPLTPAQDLAEARRRARAAKTPISKVVTQQVVDAKERTYSGQAARELGAQMRRGARSSAAGAAPKPKGTGAVAKKDSAAVSKAAPKKATPKRK